MRRDFIEVLTALLAAAPDDQDVLRPRLQHVLQSAHFTAPEARWPYRGSQVQGLLGDHVAPFAGEPWADKVLAIWTGKERS